VSDAKSWTSPALCPSAQPEWESSVALGVIAGTADKPLMVHFASPTPVTDELLALSSPVTPTEVFRFAAPCMCAGCVHFVDAKCGLATRVVTLLPVVMNTLPRCAIRPHCRWWQQEGKAACMRCPQVVTANYNPSEAMRLAADPTTPTT
jgi:hypothetical protein